MKNIITLFVVLLSTVCSAQDPYDTSTPEKFVLAMGQTQEKSKEHYPIPHFYEKNAAEGIKNYDAAGRIASKSFAAFKQIMLNTFPNQASTRMGKLKIASSDGSTATFSFSISIIEDQITSRSADAYEYVSTKQEGDTTQIILLMAGNEITIPTKKYDGELKMFMAEKDVNNLIKMTAFAQSANELFTEWTKLIKTDAVNADNLATKTMEWEGAYIKIASMLN